MATKTKLEVLSGETFDKSYVKGMMKDHQEDIAMFKEEAMSGRDPDAEAFASTTLPTPWNLPPPRPGSMPRIHI